MPDFYNEDYESVRPKRRPKKVRERGDSVENINRVRTHSRDAYDVDIPTHLFKYIALAILTIVILVSGVVSLKISLPIVFIILAIVIAMGVLLHTTPVFVSVILAAIILIVGMITKNVDIVLAADALFMTTILVLKNE